MKGKVCILYTGGTIGMVPTDEGYAPKKNYFTSLLDEITQLRHRDMPDWDIVEFDPLLDSSNIAIKEWNDIGRAILKRYDDYDGFVILHGTDTMAYTASALSFMLEGLNKPVIITGAQIPLCEIRSDGRDNLIDSIVIASQGVAKEVCIYFAGCLMRGNRSSKTSADELGAFTSPNYPTLANVGIEIKYDEQALMLPSQSDEFSLRELSDVPIGVLKFFPGMQFQLFEQIITEKLSSVVIEAFGEGNIPSDNPSLLQSIKRASENGAVIAVVSQCFQGSTKLGAYATSSELAKLGAVGCLDMTTEATVAKLYYLASCGYDTSEIKRLMATDLRGEISK